MNLNITRHEGESSYYHVGRNNIARGESQYIVKNYRRVVDDLKAFMADIGEDGRVIFDAAAFPLLRIHDAYNFTRPSYMITRGYHRWPSTN